MKKLLFYILTIALTIPFVAQGISVAWNKTTAGKIYPPIVSDYVGIGTTTPYAPLSVVGQIVASYFTGTTTATSTLAGGLSANILNTTSTTASSTFANGLNLTAGCFSISGTCVGAGGSGTVTSVAMSVPTGLSVSGSPITTSGTLALNYTAGYEGLLTASSTNWNGFYDTPSTRITAGTNLSWSGNTLNATGGGTFSWTPQSWGVSTSTTLGFLNGFLSTASSTITSDLRLSGLSAGGVGVGTGGLLYSGATTTAGTGLTYSGNQFNVNTSQNIATLSNLTSNGFVKTSGGVGTLSVDTSTYLTTVDISANTNLAVTSPIVLTGDTLSFGTAGVAFGGTGATTFGQGWLHSAGGTSAFTSSTSPTVNYLTVTSTTATSTFAGGISANAFNAVSTTASSTFANGINLGAGCFAINNTCIGGGSGITSLEGLTAATQTFADDTNVTISSSGSTHTLGWTGTLAVARGGSGAGTLTGLLQGNGTSAFTAITGTTGQFPYYNGTNTLLATSTLFLNTTGYLGIFGSTTPWSALSVKSGGSITVGENTLATSTSMTVSWNDGNQQLVRLGTDAVSITFSNFIDGQTLKVIACAPGSAPGTITWATQVLWAGGVEPGQNATADKCDVWSFVATQATSTLKIFGAMSSSF